MLLATVYAPAGEPPTSLLVDYAGHLERTGRGKVGYPRAARAFLRRWPDPQAWAICGCVTGSRPVGRPRHSWCF
jgi:hypothetical protein